MSGTRVLLVDDEAEFVATLAERLRARGLSVDTAQDGEIALAKAREKLFEAVLLDLAMPGIDGLETLKRLLQINPDLQVILLTGKGGVEPAVEAMKLGALDFLQKPVDIAALVARIELAATRRLRLQEKRISDQVSDILRKKGW